MNETVLLFVTRSFYYGPFFVATLQDRTKSEEEEETPQIIRMEDKKTSSSTAGGGKTGDQAELEEPN